MIVKKWKQNKGKDNYVVPSNLVFMIKPGEGNFSTGLYINYEGKVKSSRPSLHETQDKLPLDRDLEFVSLSQKNLYSSVAVT